MKSCMRPAFSVQLHRVAFLNVYLILRSKKKKKHMLTEAESPAICLQCHILGKLPSMLCREAFVVACLHASDWARVQTKYCCPVVGSQTMGALSVASLFVFRHVMLHGFGTFYCLLNHLFQGQLMDKRLQYGMHLKRTGVFDILHSSYYYTQWSSEQLNPEDPQAAVLVHLLHFSANKNETQKTIKSESRM